MKKFNKMCTKAYCDAKANLRRKLNDKRGQATVEYVVILGVIVVIAITAILLFKESLIGLWQDISDGINGL